MNKNQHVYCTNCVRGDALLKYIEDDRSADDKAYMMPVECERCDPYDCEDSRRFVDRPNYVEA